jgi:hypothetical protein
MLAIDYPTIEVGGRQLTVRYTLAAQILMVRRGMDPSQLGVLLGPGLKRAENLVQLFACMVAENFIPDGMQFSLDGAPSADYWATQIEPGQLGEIDRVCAVAMGKVTEALRSKLAVVPPVEQAS